MNRSLGWHSAARAVIILNVFRRLLILAWLCAVPVLAGPDDDFVEIYQLIQQTDSFREQGQFSQARTGYERAQELLRALKKGYPQWNDRVIAYRLRYVAEKLEALPSVETPSPVVVAEPVAKPVEAPANEVLTQFNALNSEIGTLRSEKIRLEAKLREALTAQPAPVDPKELQAAVDRITQLQATNKALLTRLETQQQERTTLVEKVLLEEAQKALQTANQQLSGQQEKTVELERLRKLTEAELKRLQEVDLKGLKSENSMLKSQVDALQSETERGQQIANLTQRLEVLQSKFEEANRANELLVADRDQLAKQLQELKVRQTEEGVLRVKQLETDLALARAEADRHSATAVQLETKLSAETVSRARLEGENKDLVKRLESLTQQVTGVKLLQTQLTAEQEEREELEAQLKAAEEQLAAVSLASDVSGKPSPTVEQGQVTAGSLPDPALVSQIQILSGETVRLREALREGRARQLELSSLLTDAQSAVARLESEKRGLLKSMAELQATPSQRQVARTQRTITSLEEKVRSLEKERDKLAQRLAQASEKSKSGIQFARRARLGIPREDAQRFRDSRN